MADVRPFRGLRPTPDNIKEVASPPYDVLNSDEAREKAKGHPNSFLHVVKPEIDLDPSTDIYDTRVYTKGAENLNRLIQSGIMLQDEIPCFYIYRLQMGDTLHRAMAQDTVSDGGWSDNRAQGGDASRRRHQSCTCEPVSPLCL